MKKKIILFSIILAIGIFAFVQNSLSFAQASGGFEITYLGDPIHGPIFNIHNMLPGDCFVREVKAKNNGSSPTEFSVRSINEEDNDDLSTQIDFEIKEGITLLFSNTLKNFYNTNSVSLGTINAGAEKTYVFKACFKISAGNEYQDTKTEFDLKFSTKDGETPHELPAECKNLRIEKFIIGNSGNNHLEGSSKRDFISGLGGNDQIRGNSDQDCLVGGEGNDVLRGGSGNDFLDGGPGNDTLFGNSGQDKCVNGENNHSCEL